MRLKAITGIVLAALLIGVLTLAFNIPYVKANGSWVWVRDTVTGAWGEAVVGTGDAIYVARKTSFYRYTPADNSWTALATPSNPDSGDAFKTGTALAWDFSGYIYALYGAATVDSRRWFYRYSISGNSWQALADTPADQGEGDAITFNGTYIYATIGGEQRSTYFVRYDPSTNSWSDEPADPPAGMGDGASLVWTGGDFLYALRGEFDETTALYDFWRYSLTDDVWAAMADIPADPHDGGIGGVGDGGSLLYVGHWLSTYTDYIYALSGNQVNEIPDNRAYRYTISMNSWERLADLPFKVGYYVGCRLGYADGHIYAWQGAPGTWTGGGDDLARYKLDSTPPIIGDLNCTPCDNVQPEQAVNVSVNVTDVESGVKNVTLFYTTNNGTTWENLAMNYNASTSLYEATIPSQPAETWVKCKIVAYDYAGNNSTRYGTEPCSIYKVVPEFPSILILPLFMVLTMLTILYVKKRVPTKPKN